MLKRTPLFECHQQLGGKLVEFGGWEMPVQYTSITDEHQVVRKHAGLFDIAHMGEVLVSGAGAAEFLNRTLTNDVTKLTPGLGQYTLMCRETGGVMDDLYLYQLAPLEYLLIINASRIDVDVAWLQERWAAFPAAGTVELRDVSAETGAVALQGPRAAAFIGDVFPGPANGGTLVARVTELRKNQIARWEFAGQPVWVARTGYTGEDGFEVVAPAGVIVAVWQKILAAGHPYCLQPAGLGARDTLRTEVCYPLYGHELDEQTTPIEAGLGFFVALDKGEFVGRAALAAQKAAGPARKCVAFKMTERSAPPRPQYAVWSTGPEAAAVGTVVSGTQSPSLGVGIGMAYVPAALARPGTAIAVEIRGKRAAAVVVPKPIYLRPVPQTPATV